MSIATATPTETTIEYTTRYKSSDVGWILRKNGRIVISGIASSKRAAIHHAERARDEENERAMVS